MNEDSLEAIGGSRLARHRRAVPAAGLRRRRQAGRRRSIVTYKDDLATLDPAIGYDWQNWSMIKSMFTG